MQKKKKPITFTVKQTRVIAKESATNVLLVVMAILSDKYKFDADKLEKFMSEVQFASSNLWDTIDRKDLIEIIKRHTGYDFGSK